MAGYLDPNKQFNKGLLAHALRGRPNQDRENPAYKMREYANRSNSGTLPWQVDQQEMGIKEEQREPNLALKKAQTGQANRSGFSSTMNDYMKFAKMATQYGLKVPSFMDFSKSSTTAKLPAAAIQVGDKLNAYDKIIRDPNSTPDQVKNAKAQRSNLERAMPEKDIGVSYEMKGDVLHKITRDTAGVREEPVSKDDPKYETGIQQAEESIRRKGGAEAQQQMDNDFRDMAANQMPDWIQQYKETEKYAKAIEDGSFQNTGPFESVWTKYTDPETATAQLRSIDMVLKNLERTNLAPVTEQEINLVQELYARIGKDPKVNVALLREANAILKRHIGLMEKKREYWRENDGTLKGYGLGNTGKSWADLDDEDVTDTGGGTQKEETTAEMIDRIKKKNEEGRK